MEITIYGLEHCSQCKMLKRKLEEKNIEFFYIEDEETIMKIAEKTGIMSAPIVEIDGQCFDLKDAAKRIGL
jgi:glutaredoxin